MPATDLSPNVDNYFVGAGIVSWAPIATPTVYRDVGNVSKFEFTSAVTRLKHYSSRHGTQFKDADVVTRVDATAMITMEELTASNLAMHLLSDETNPDVLPVMLNILNTPEMKGALRLLGTNDVGAAIQLDLPNCLITPSGAVGLINAGTWAEIQLTVEVNGDINTGIFGRLAWGITKGVAIAYP